MSNDVQVEQATRAVWQVTGPNLPKRLDFECAMVADSLYIVCEE